MKTRFSPSPTGRMHLGNVRTALFNYLAAISGKGTFLLRIEDTDMERSQDQFTLGIEEDLQWLGLQWHEGPRVGGEHGPYFQSQREVIYEQYYRELMKKGLVYPCFCSEEQLELSRKVQRSSGIAPRYAGTCRYLSKEAIEEKIHAGLKPALRFKIPANQRIEFDDAVRGHQVFQSDDLGDFIIRRADGMTMFMYSNAIDDSLMGTTLALRGEDHLTNTPRQLLILQALGLRAPQYGHISLVVSADGSKFSKREGSRSLQELRVQGFLPMAINNYLSRIGHTYESEKWMSLQTLGEQFRLSALGKSPTRYDEQQLLYWQKEAVMQLSYEEFLSWSKFSEKDISIIFYEAVRGNVLFPSEVQFWQTTFTAELHYSDEALLSLREAGADFFQAALSAVIQCNLDIKPIVSAVKEITGKKGPALFMPLRFALTGVAHGPDLSHLLSCLGETTVKQRLAQALQHVKTV